LNLLDTPGHADFSEDTYRVLSAVDSAVMLIDHTKGIEARTLKLFEVCRMRGLPIVTFMNKLDRDGIDPLALLDEISKTLDLHVCPMNWPVGSGRDFKGVVDIATRQVLLYEGGEHGQERVELKTVPLDGIGAEVGERVEREVNEQLELLSGAGDPWTREAFLGGRISPIFWGSAMTNFGVEPLLDFLAEQAAAPAPRKAIDDTGAEITVSPEEPTMSGFIFKIQANMNPRHRDRIAFLRIVSGEFERDMEATVGRSGEVIKLSKPHSFLAQERSIVDEAHPGDIVGLFDPGKLRIGDTLAEGRVLKFGGIPRFAPEHFARVVLKDPMRRKQLDTGLSQLSLEGVIQLFYREETGTSDPWLGAVGLLQFEVLKERLLTEYRVQTVIESLPYAAARWVGGAPEGLAWLQARRDYKVVRDRNGQPVVLAETEWGIQYALRNAKGLELHDVEPM
jgi:peptide chain release factor 3